MDESKALFSGIGFLIAGILGLLSLKYKFLPHGNRKNSLVISILALVAGITLVTFGLVH